MDDPRVFARFARLTDAPMPAHLAATEKRAQAFNQGIRIHGIAGGGGRYGVAFDAG